MINWFNDRQFRQNTTDAFEISLIEDYYNTFNDSLKSSLKRFNNYQEVDSGVKRVKIYRNKTQATLTALVNEKRTMSKEIEAQRSNLEKIESNNKVIISI